MVEEKVENNLIEELKQDERTKYQNTFKVLFLRDVTKTKIS